jgi:hypothetical protein
VTKLSVVGIALLFGLLIGLTHEPDSGTAASVGAPDLHAAMVGPNHAKPLPHVPTESDLLALWQVLTPTLIALLLLFRPTWAGFVRVERDPEPDPSVSWSLARARRGPPALA